MGDDLRYNSSRCFQPFPFPLATTTQQDRIREVAEQLYTLRKQQQAQHPTLTITDLYNVVEKLQASPSLPPKKQMTNQLGLALVVLNLHQQLDGEVAAAYGWAADLSETELFNKLVRLNKQRVAGGGRGSALFASELSGPWSTTGSFYTLGNPNFYDCFGYYPALTYCFSGTNAGGESGSTTGSDSYDCGTGGSLLSTYSSGKSETIIRHVDGAGIGSADSGGSLCWVGSGEKTKQKSSSSEK